MSTLIKAFGNLTVKNCLYQILDAVKRNSKTLSATIKDVTTALQNYLQYADKRLKRAKSCEKAE